MKPSSYIVEQQFQEKLVLFRSDGWVNATQLAAGYDVRIRNFMRLDGTVRYVETLQTYLTRKTNTLTSERVSRVEVVERIEGRGGGTWFHPLLAIEFARWLDPELSIWCNEVVLEVMGGKPVTPDTARKLWSRHSALELLGWCQDVMLDAAPQGARIKEIRGNATEIRDVLIKRGYEPPAVNWLGRWLTDLKATHGQEVAEFSRGHARREWVIRARPG